MDVTELRKRILIYCAVSPSTLLPIVGGVTVLLAQWAMGAPSPLWILGGLAAPIVGVGIFCTQLLLNREGIAKKVLATLEREAVVEQEQALDDLRQRLLANNGKRTVRCLDDLRALQKTFRHQQAVKKGNASAAMSNITDTMQELFDGCIKALERTLELRQSAKELKNPQLRQPLIDERDRLVESVESSIKKIGDTLAGLVQLTVDDGSNSGISHIQCELDEQLETARTVDRQMREFEATSKLEQQE